MKKFQYQVIRFLPDRVSGEFINLGVVVYSPQLRELCVDVITKTSRITQVFPRTNTKYILKVVKHVEDALNTIAARMSAELSFETYENIQSITKKVLPVDDSALFFTDPEEILDLDIKSSITYLYERLVGANLSEHDNDTRTDKEVWSKVYKQYFDELNISKYLKPEQISTQFDPVTFEHTWRNGHLNFFEAVNFDLKQSETIRHKVFRWAGQIDELKTANEPSHLYLLSVLPKQDERLNKFVRDFLKTKSSEKVKVEIVTSENVKAVTNEIKKEMEQHYSVGS